MKLERDPRCAERNGVVGLRGGECSPLRFGVARLKKGLPSSTADALKIINAQIPGPPLTEDKVHVHYMEAASTRFIGDRHMFLASSTLDRIAKGANAGGFAFMNSHRTGDVSTPSELPFGRAFSGATGVGEDGHRVAHLGVYMLRGIRPNGANSPSTDDLSASIAGGTIFDVSMGLYGGRRVCDVCDQDFMAKDKEGRYLCDHVPGTHRKMSPAQVKAQEAKGIPEGKATYTLHDAEPGEVSAVYDGAVPGAGFRKAVSLAKRGELSQHDVDELLAAYADIEIPESFIERFESSRRLAASTRLSRGQENYRPSAPMPSGPPAYGSPEDLERLGRATRAAAYGEPMREDDGDLSALARATRQQMGLSTDTRKPDRPEDDDLARLGRATREMFGL